jgi:succinate-semialdehyde dehydrogenase/glutarate-semialdehyde dehydrogenase
MALAAKGAKRLTLELGGSDPLIVLKDADLAGAASAASVGRFFNCGQACLAVKRVFVAEEVADDFIERLVTKAQKLTIGPGTMDGVFLGPLHSETQRSEIEDQVEDARQSGEILTGGRRPDGDQYENGWFYAPTIVNEPARDSKVAREEVFGPVLPVWRVSGLQEAIDRANDSPFGLGSSIWTHDLDAASWAAERIQAGYTWVNSPQRIFDELPFGGWGASGFGKEHGIEALDHYQEAKSVVVRRQRPS